MSRVVFFGTPAVALPALDAIHASAHEVAAVVTKPDRPRGRGRAVSSSPVKEAAERHGIPVLQPSSPKEPGFADALRALEPETCAVVAYGHLLPVDVLVVAPAINVHFSLLPRYRGAAPVQRALMDGATETGISVFLLEPTMDTGPVLLREHVAVGSDETTGEVLARLAPIGARMVVGGLDLLEAGPIEPQPQDDAAASPAPKIRPEEARIDWSLPAIRLHDLVRALNPRPGAYTIFRGRRLMVWRSRVLPDEPAAPPGSVIASDGATVATGAGALWLVEVQPEGKRRMSGEEFARGYRPSVAEIVGAPGGPEGGEG